MKMLRTLISVVATTLLVQFAVATNHTVGAPDGGWDEMTDLQKWASSQKFFVGDALIFAYAPNHDVLEVSKADYDTCTPDNAKTISAGGLTIIQLTTPGKKYFICGSTGHCALGMKLEIEVLTSAASPPPPSPPPATPSTTPPVSAPSPVTETPWTAAPHAEPISAPVWSPTYSPKHSPAYSPNTSPAPAPSKVHAKSPSKAPAHSPTKAPSKSIAPSTSPSGIFATVAAPASAATKVNAIAGSMMGFSFAIMMLLTL